MLGALEADISEVWPFGNAQLESRHEGCSYQIQILRLQEVLNLSGAAGIALLAINESCRKVLMQQALSDSEVQSLMNSLQQGNHLKKGLWFETGLDDTKFFLFLKATECPSFVKQVIEHYLIIWRRVYLRGMHSAPAPRPLI
jgi:hypothetical protein